MRDCGFAGCESSWQEGGGGGGVADGGRAVTGSSWGERGKKISRPPPVSAYARATPLYLCDTLRIRVNDT